MAYQARSTCDRWRLRHGRPRPPARPTTVRAGAVTAILDGIDLRYLSLGSTEFVRRITVAVRDTDWGTVEPETTDLELEQRAKGFELRFTARHARGPILFTWQGTVRGGADGTIAYELDGRAGRDFEHNRIGLCVLLPPEPWCGSSFRASGGDGVRSGTLPHEVAPEEVVDGIERPLVPAFERLRLDRPDGALELAFAGERFEIEDQRNWTDASFKVYSTPLSLGTPRRLAAGESVRQSVTVTPDPPTARTAGIRRPRSGARPVPAVDLTVGRELRLPALGVVDPGAVEPALDERLCAAAPAHLRFDLWPGDESTGARARAALARASRLGAKLEPALHLADPGRAPIEAVLRGLPTGRVARLLVFGVAAGAEGTVRPDLVAAVRGIAGRLGLDLPVGGGSDRGFHELNRSRPAARALDIVAFPLSPVVHASDERSIVETLTAQPAVFETAARFVDGADLAVTPIALDQLDAGPGRRGRSLFAAAWTLGTVASLAAAGVSSATFSVSGATPQGPDEPCPVLDLLGALAEPGIAAWALEPDRPFAATGLLLRGSDCLRLLVASTIPEPSILTIGGLPPGAGRGAATLRRLDLAPSRPDPPPRVTLTDAGRGSLALEVGPYGLAIVDLDRGD